MEIKDIINKNPTNYDLQMLKINHNLTASRIAFLTGVSTRNVQRWLADEDNSTGNSIPPLAWRYLLLATGEITPEALVKALDDDKELQRRLERIKGI